MSWFYNEFSFSLAPLSPSTVFIFLSWYPCRNTKGNNQERFSELKLFSLWEAAQNWGSKIIGSIQKRKSWFHFTFADLFIISLKKVKWSLSKMFASLYFHASPLLFNIFPEENMDGKGREWVKIVAILFVCTSQISHFSGRAKKVQRRTSTLTFAVLSFHIDSPSLPSWQFKRLTKKLRVFLKKKPSSGGRRRNFLFFRFKIKNAEKLYSSWSLLLSSIHAPLGKDSTQIRQN